LTHLHYENCGASRKDGEGNNHDEAKVYLPVGIEYEAVRLWERIVVGANRIGFFGVVDEVAHERLVDRVDVRRKRMHSVRVP